MTAISLSDTLAPQSMRLVPDGLENDDSTMLLPSFVQRKFIPNHVMLKTPAGQTHYHAILKYLITPEKVDQLFAPYGRTVKGRLKTIPAWPYLDEVRLCDLKAEHVLRLALSAVSHGYSPQTTKHIRNLISAIVTHAKKERLHNGDNPGSSVLLPPMVRKKRPALTIQQAKRLVTHLDYPEREIALLTLNTGISLWEVCALQWKDVNLTTKVLRVEGEAIPAGSMLVTRQWTTEGELRACGTHKRILILPEPLIRVLTRLQQDRDNRNPTSFVIATRAGNPCQPAAMRLTRLKAVGKQMAMPWLTWEVLRLAHTNMLVELRNRLSAELVLSANI